MVKLSFWLFFLGQVVMAKQNEFAEAGASAPPNQFSFTNRVVFSLLGVPVLPGTVIFIFGLIDFHDAYFAYSIMFALYATGLSYLILPITLIVLLKKGVQRPIPLAVALSAVYGALFLLVVLLGLAEFSLLGGLIFVALGGVSALLFWAAGILKRASL